MKCNDCYDCYWYNKGMKCDGYSPTGPGGICVHWRHKDYPYPYTTREQAYKKKNKEGECYQRYFNFSYNSYIPYIRSFIINIF